MSRELHARDLLQRTLGLIDKDLEQIAKVFEPAVAGKKSVGRPPDVSIKLARYAAELAGVVKLQEAQEATALRAMRGKTRGELEELARQLIADADERKRKGAVRQVGKETEVGGPGSSEPQARTGDPEATGVAADGLVTNRYGILE